MKRYLIIFLIFTAFTVNADVDTKDGVAITTTSNIDGFSSNIEDYDNQVVSSGGGTPISYGYGTGDNDNQTSSGYLYTSMAGSAVAETFDVAGDVDEITVYNNTASGRLRVWKGTWSSLTFTFDSYTEVVDVSGVSTGWVTLTAPSDFTAFAVTSSTGLVFYTHSTNTTGLIIGRSTSGTPKYYGSNSADPPFSGDITFTYSAAARLEVLVTGED